MVVAVVSSVAACTQPGAAKLCEAIVASDVAAAEQALKVGTVDMLRQQGLCHPAFDVLQARDESSARILTAMLGAGLDANATLSRSGSGRRGGRSSTTTQSLVEWAARHAPYVEALIAAGLDVKGPAAGRAVVSAAAGGVLEVVTRLVDAGASVNEPALDEFGAASPRTALGFAVAGRHHPTIAYLEGKGARFAAGDVSPIFEAARQGDLEAVKKALAAGADVNAPDPYGHPALFRAAGFGQVAVVETLLSAKATPDTFVDGATALHAAATEGHAAVVRSLVRGKANPNARFDEATSTALVDAVQAGHTEVVSALLDGGADPAAPGIGGTPLLLAVQQRRLPMVEALLRAKANPNQKAAATDWPVLHTAVTGCEAQDFDVPLLRALVAAGADVKATDAEGKTARQKAEASLQGETRAFYKACYEARVAALKALGG